MEASATPSTSKVILQCTDPSNLLESFEYRLASRTPLKNLHWKSPSRPLRSIPSLNITLVRKDASQNGTGGAVRRHQIPGLRETPYVKLYLLRCDDKEIYKETARKEIKQWIKDNTFEKESKSSLRNHEHHDAFEWMIVHVVVPGTAAAHQPASSKHLSLNDTESTDSINSKSKWTGKSTSTIYDKLRADFSSSKLATPRVAQVRLSDPAKPPGALAPSEIEEQWHDFVDNLKATILKSFDTRVAQYEDDIRERESQRSLPGWNFCTFFMLKEGLARGFDNVGLLDDALTVYAELEVGLDSVVKEHANRREGEMSGALLPFSNDLKANIRRALDEKAPELDGDITTPSLQDMFSRQPPLLPFDIERRNYRDLILANEVSPLDVRIYIFTRQMNILLRRARLTVLGAKDPAIDCSIMADLAELALNFINLGSRELRVDMQAAWGGRISGQERALQKVIIGNVVASWTWSAVVQTLRHLLPVMDLDLSQFGKSDDVLEEDALLDQKKVLPQTPNGRSPTSSASSSPRRGLRPESLSRAVSRSPAGADEPNSRQVGIKKPGFDQLLSTAARLFLLARKTMENVPAATKWVNALRDLNVPGYERASNKLHRLSSALSFPTTNGETEHETAETSADATQSILKGLDVDALIAAGSSEDHFHNLYRILSQVMHHLYVEASNKHSARQVLIDLAMLSYSQGDRSIARAYLSTVVGPDSHDPLVAAQPHILALYADCLRDADRPNDLATCLLACLRSSAPQQSLRRAQQQYDQLTETASRTSDLRLPLKTIAEVVKVDRAISHQAGQSGFLFSVVLRATVPVELHSLASATVKLRALDQQDPLSIWLECNHVPSINQVARQVQFSTSISTEGLYAIEHLEMWLGKIRFDHYFQPGRESVMQSELRPFLRTADAPPIRVYIPSDSFRLRATQSQTIDLSRRRSLLISISGGEHAMSKCSLTVRPRTAGLRLALHEASRGEEGQQSMQVVHENDTTFLRFEELVPTKPCVIRIPYTLESQLETVALLRCVLEGTSNGSRQIVHQTCSLDVNLAFSVNVQDVYRNDYWYSHFLLSPATSSPIVLLGCKIDSEEGITVESSAGLETATTVFAQQPARWLTRLRKTDPQPSAHEPLKLEVQYQRLDEVALNTLRSVFCLAVKEAGFAAMAELLSSHLVDTLRASWAEHDLEMIGLTYEVQLPNRADSHWDAVLRAFDHETQNRLRCWLDEWRQSVNAVPLDLSAAMVRELRLNVEIRPVPPVVTVELRPSLSATRTTAPLGQPLVCQLKIMVGGQQETGLQYSYELLATSEAWLVGGKKKGIFFGSEGIDIPVVLFPQRVGLLMLPSIDVRCKKQMGNSPQTIDGGLVDVPIEVFNQTGSTSVQITSNLRSATVGLAAEGATAHAGTVPGNSSGLLLQSHSRTDE